MSQISTHSSATLPHPDQARWDERYRSGCDPGGGEVNPWIVAQRGYLTGGRVLDVACGSGRHTLWLAGLGYEVEAVDISAVALQQAAARAASLGLSASIHLLQADLNQWQPAAGRYDLVLVSLYLERALLPTLEAAVRPGGMLLYSSYHTDLRQIRPEFPTRHLLQPGELLATFRHLELLAYEERRLQAADSQRWDCTSSILVRTPPARPL